MDRVGPAGSGAAGVLPDRSSPLGADDPSDIYFQRAQAASDASNFDEALALYRSFLSTHPDATREEQYSARYEVALLLAKTGNQAAALAGFEQLVADYDDLDKSAGAPAWVKVLAQKKLAELKKTAR